MKKGFTLMELLAVIVILAIISAIATPIVLNIIKDAREASSLRSAEMYLEAVEQTIAVNKMTGLLNSATCSINENGNLLCGETFDELIVDAKGEKPIGGSIQFSEGKIKDINLLHENNQQIVKNDKGELISQINKILDAICKYDSSSGAKEKTIGAKYSCEVKPGASYNFYVLTTPKSTDTTISLIMDQNIYNDGTPAGTTGVKRATGVTKYSFEAWNSSGSNTGGPVTVINFLHNATKDWVNIEPLNYIYNDKEMQGTTSAGISYTSFVSNEGIATITSLTGESVIIGTEDNPLRTRIPIYSSDATKTEVTKSTNATAFLYDNLNSSCKGYWTLSTNPSSSVNARYVRYENNIYSNKVSYYDSYGVRPVITLRLK